MFPLKIFKVSVIVTHFFLLREAFRAFELSGYGDSSYHRSFLPSWNLFHPVLRGAGRSFMQYVKCGTSVIL